MTIRTFNLEAFQETVAQCVEDEYECYREDPNAYWDPETMRSLSEWLDAAGAVAENRPMSAYSIAMLWADMTEQAEDDPELYERIGVPDGASARHAYECYNAAVAALTDGA